MNLRCALLVAALALAATALRAEELQFTISGVADCAPNPSLCTGQPTTGPGTITFELNTLSATLTPTFANNPGNNPVGGPLGEVLTNLSVSFPLTNYFAIVAGHTIGFAEHGSGSFSCFGFPVGPIKYQCGGTFSPGHGPGAFNFDDNEVWISVLTEAQYKAFQDPLASILLSDTSPPGVGCGFGGILCFMDQGPGTSVHFDSRFTVTRVPTPGPLSLFVAGLLGLVLSWRRKRLGSFRLPVVHLNRQSRFFGRRKGVLWKFAAL